MSQAKAVSQKFSLLVKHSLNSWQFWAIIITLFSGTAGFFATNALLKLPKTPQCARIFWPVASASLRLYCADLEAEKGTVEGLLTAINLVEALPANHSLRLQVDQSTQYWIGRILDLGEEKFQQGHLQNALDIANQIPAPFKEDNLVQQKTRQWQAIWEDGEKIFADIENELRDADWNMAFRYAVKFLSLDNQYWATIKYDETIETIERSREERRQLEEALGILRRDGIDNWLKAVEVAEKISEKSYSHSEAQKLLAEAKQKIVNYVNNAMEQQEWNILANATNRIPESLGLSEELLTWRSFASAGLDADLGTVEGLKEAIASLETVEANNPHYTQAQALIQRWTVEIEDVAYLSQARELARGGTVEDLQKAISQAKLISFGNPRYSEAKEDIEDWNRQIQMIEDQPILEQARTLAAGGSVNDLKKAINQASLISSNRVLYQEAREDINQWRRRIERQEDMPILDEARTLGNLKDYVAAIDTAQQIAPQRVLYSEAQSYIQGWRKEVKAQQDLDRAYAIARINTSDSLFDALEIVRRIPEGTDVSGQRLAALNRWGYQLLNIANEKGNNAQFAEAIDLARRIPAESPAYSTARSQIQYWRTQILPKPVPRIRSMQPFPAQAPEPVPASEQNPQTEAISNEP